MLTHTDPLHTLSLAHADHVVHVSTKTRRPCGQTPQKELLLLGIPPELIFYFDMCWASWEIIIKQRLCHSIECFAYLAPVV